VSEARKFLEKMIYVRCTKCGCMAQIDDMILKTHQVGFRIWYYLHHKPCGLMLLSCGGNKIETEKEKTDADWLEKFAVDNIKESAERISTSIETYIKGYEDGLNTAVDKVKEVVDRRIKA
jgi:hypothetical protein